MITTAGRYFQDEHGRTLILRGANLSGSSKVPFTPDGASWQKDHFYEHRTVSFVGRPFPLAEADEHLRRLASWGMTFLRFIVTWEAIEHAGPGQYDEAYLDYVRAVLEKAHGYGIRVLIDFHQDVWSRWTGGDGAPGWTLEAVGMDLTRLAAVGAAFTHQTHGDPFPRMIWSSNYGRFGAFTMFTLFFAGRDFAPNLTIDGENVQDYLQGHYLRAVRQLAERLKDLPNVVGCDPMNEPSRGLIGVQDLALHGQQGIMALGPMPTPFQAFAAASGHPQTVRIFDLGVGLADNGEETVVNADGVSLWREGYQCLWKQHGVWTDEGEPRLLRPDYFAQVDGKPVEFLNDYLKPFVRRFIREIRAVSPSAICFLEGEPGGEHPAWRADDPPNAANAAHWYDGLTLFTKQYNPDFGIDYFTKMFVTGSDAVRQSYIDQLAHPLREADQKMNGIPTLIGEFGLPFDLDDKSAYRTGDYSSHIRALDNYYDALDANLLSATIWNYTPDNTNARGDLWNDEDLSIFSRDQQHNPNDINSGGRALTGCVRPYARSTAGKPLRMAFVLSTVTFEYEYEPDPAVTMPTEIFVPLLQYPNGVRIEAEGAVCSYDRATQIITVRAKPDARRVRVTLSAPT